MLALFRKLMSAGIGLRGIALAILVLAPVFVLGGCGKFLESKQPNRNSLTIQDEKLKCLDTLPQDLGTWLDTGKPDIDTTMNCAVKAIDEFSDKTQGDAPGSWSRQSLATFINTYFAKNHGMMGTDINTWILEVVRLKVLLLGGAEDRVTSAELKRVRDLLIRAKPILRELSPYVQTIIFNAKDQADGKAAAAGKAVQELANLLADELQQGQTDRPVIEISTLVQSIHNLGVKSEKVDSWLPLAEAVKAIVVGGEKTVITQKEWPLLLRSVGQLWSLGLRAKYDVLNSNDALGSDLPKLESTVEEGFDFLEKSIHSQGDDPSVIGIRLLEDAINALAEKDLLPMHISATTAQGLLKPVLIKILHGNSKGDTEEIARGFSLSHAAALREVARDWIYGQKLLLRTLGDNKEMNLEEFATALAQVPTESRDLDPDRLRINARASAQLVDLFKHGRPIMFTADHRMVVTPRIQLPMVTRYDVDVANAARAGIAMVLRGYSHDPSTAASTGGVSENEAQEIYLDFKDLGKDIGLMDVRNNTAGTRTFMEANLFQSVSNGNSLIELHEAVEWFGTVLGGGMLADRIHDSMLRECADREGRIDVLGKVKLDVRCFRQHFKADFQKNFSNLPGLAKWVKDDATGQRFDQLLVALETAGRNKGYNDGLIDSSEMRALMPILHYTESLFARFDVNRNGILDTEELWSAFPILQPFIRKMANGNAEDEKMQKAIFSYLLTWGQPPAPSIIGGLGVFAWQWGRYAVHETADRLNVLKVMSSFAIAAKQDRARQISEYYKLRKVTLRNILLTKQDAELQKITELFYCLPQATPLVADLLQLHVNDIAPANKPLDVKDFFSRTDHLIDSEPKLEVYCLPF